MIRSGLILMIKDSAEKGKSAYAISKELGIAKNTANPLISIEIIRCWLRDSFCFGGIHLWGGSIASFFNQKKHGERKLCKDFRERIFSSKFTENLSDFWSASFWEKQTHFAPKLTFRYGVSEKQVLSKRCFQDAV